MGLFMQTRQDEVCIVNKTDKKDKSLTLTLAFALAPTLRLRVACYVTGKNLSMPCLWSHCANRACSAVSDGRLAVPDGRAAVAVGVRLGRE